MIKLAALLLLYVACKSDPPARQAPPSTRPASISDADVASVEQLLANIEQLATAVNAAGTDCTKAATAIQTTATESAALLAETAEIDRQTRKDPAAESWAFANYGVRMMKAMGQLMEGPCSKDDAYAAALKRLQAAR
jgi:hypothetical protein